MYAADVTGRMYFGLRPLSTLGTVTGKDTIGYTTHFWREFEIRVKKVAFFTSLKDIDS